MVALQTAFALEPVSAGLARADYVFLARGKGRFEPRIVRLGASAGGRVQVLEGLAEADEVVTTANFLVDSESRLRSAVEAFGAPAGHDEDETTRKTARAAAGGHP